MPDTPAKKEAQPTWVEDIKLLGDTEEGRATLRERLRVIGWVLTYKTPDPELGALASDFYELFDDANQASV